MQLSYRIHGSGKSVAADGMGLFLVKERTKQGSAIGGPERFQGFALLLDSYKNGGTAGNFPLVSFSTLLKMRFLIKNRFLVLYRMEHGHLIMILMVPIKILESVCQVIGISNDPV